MSPWKNQMLRVRRESCKRPAGCKTLHEIAVEMGLAEKQAAQVVKELVRSGKAEKVPGKTLTATGALLPIVLYRLVR